MEKAVTTPHSLKFDAAFLKSYRRFTDFHYSWLDTF
jgi:hypothetical protein